jgi:radical SAM superfamily enzyme YgiQ (UPF0313 family)
MKSNLVVLINPSHGEHVPEKINLSYGAKSRKIRRYDPPISIINLGGFIRDHGYEVVILDTQVEPDYKSRIRDLISEKPLAIGLSVIIGMFTKNAITLTRWIKEINEDIPIVWGGKLVHLAGEKIFKSLDVDFTVFGDGEVPLLQLLDCLRNERDHRHIPGIGFKENGRFFTNLNMYEVANLDEIYTSHDFGWDLVKRHINFRQLPYFLHLYTSRGCRFSCAFCYLKDVKQLEAKNRFRRRSAENIIKEIRYLHTEYGINVVTFGDDDFLSNVKDILPVLEFLREKKIYIEHLWTNVYNLTPETIKLLAGICQTVCYSIETVSPRLQKLLNKKISPERVIQINKQLRKAGINTVHNFLFGVPTETDDETRANIELIKELKRVNPHMRANTYILSPIPETPIFEHVKKMIGRNIEWDLNDLGDFHFRYMGRSASKFRPYLTPDDNLFYETISELTNELFTELNTDPTKEQLEKIRNSERLSYIFSDIHNINKPQDRIRKYILDLVIEAVESGQPLPEIVPF